MTSTPSLVPSPHFHLSTLGLSVVKKPTIDQCIDQYGRLVRLKDAAELGEADLLVYMEEHFPEDEFIQALSDMNCSEGDYRNKKSIVKTFPPDRRRPKVSYSYYQALQGIDDPDEQDAYLDTISADMELEPEQRTYRSVHHLRQHVNKKKLSSGKELSISQLISSMSKEQLKNIIRGILADLEYQATITMNTDARNGIKHVIDVVKQRIQEEE